MPELPEVETVRRGLAPFMEGARFTSVEVRRPDLRFPLPERMAERLTGRRVERLRRRGKYIVCEYELNRHAIIHLGMTGRFTVSVAEGGGQAPVFDRFVHAAGGDPAHDHIVFTMSNGARIVFNDPRRFGFFDLCEAEGDDRCPHLYSLGPEPLSNSFSGPVLLAALSGRRTPVKAALLDQAVVAGLGNIYVCEALHRARISPRRLSRDIGPARAERLYSSIVRVLTEAIEAGGSSISDFAAADGALGYFQHNFAVYGREGLPCPVCRGDVKRIVQSGRSTFYCTSCQR